MIRPMCDGLFTCLLSRLDNSLVDPQFGFRKPANRVLTTHREDPRARLSATCVDLHRFPQGSFQNVDDGVGERNHVRPLTYADYAHRGAYPLILTALLAGGFAILATRPGTAPAASRRVRLLVLLWIAQNLALVGSSIFRLWLYVQVYSLSELRLATFIWMLLVFTGLVLIILRIVLVRSDAWLLRANGVAALFMLYMAACLNVPGIVAQYDVTHCREVTGSGAALDLSYLQSLGPQAIPALDRYQVITGQGEGVPFVQQGAAGAVRVALAADLRALPIGWRSFSFWSWVLRCYLITHDPNKPVT
jgi:hypothetical protein